VTERRSLVVLTGSGISADSGLATFRGAGGLWEGHRVEDVATPEAWAEHPETVWRFYQLRRAALSTVEPNAAHRALRLLEERVTGSGHDFLLVTQNVDDLHERAGSSPLHMHGELLRLACVRCGRSAREDQSFDPERFLACPSCAHPRLRPDVVWFGEIPYGFGEIRRAAEECTHFLAVGTSGLVYPAAGFLGLARGAGATTIVNSLDEPENLDPRDRFLPGRAAEVLPRLVEELLAELRAQ
jgi:NAD-dependent deacetylase